jgi:MFS superfamily sulfate permease-like transporter
LCMLARLLRAGIIAELLSTPLLAGYLVSCASGPLKKSSE